MVWKVNSDKRSGCERFRFNGHVVDLVAEPTEDTIKITVQSDGVFQLKVISNGREQKFKILQGNNELLF